MVSFNNIVNTEYTDSTSYCVESAFVTRKKQENQVKIVVCAIQGTKMCYSMLPLHYSFENLQSVNTNFSTIESGYYQELLRPTISFLILSSQQCSPFFLFMCLQIPCNFQNVKFGYLKNTPVCLLIYIYLLKTNVTLLSYD